MNFSESGSGVMIALYNPRWRPDGDVDVVSRHARKPSETSSGVMCESISGSLGVSNCVRTDFVASSVLCCLTNSCVMVLSAHRPIC